MQEMHDLRQGRWWDEWLGFGPFVMVCAMLHARTQRSSPRSVGQHTNEVFAVMKDSCAQPWQKRLNFYCQKVERVCSGFQSQRDPHRKHHWVGFRGLGRGWVRSKTEAFVKRDCLHVAFRAFKAHLVKAHQASLPHNRLAQLAP